jgi:hypothetical protein
MVQEPKPICDAIEVALANLGYLQTEAAPQMHERHEACLAAAIVVLQDARDAAMHLAKPKTS